MGQDYHKYYTPVLIVLLTTLAMGCTLIYSFEIRVYSLINPVVGVSTAMFVIHRKKAILPTLLTIFVLSFLVRVFFTDDLFLFSLGYSVVLLIPYLAMMYLFDYIYRRTKIGNLSKVIAINKGYVFPYLLNVLVTSIVGSVLFYLVHYAFIPFTGAHLTILKEIFFSVFFGLFLFNMIIHFAMTKDYTVFPKRTAIWFNLLYLGLFTALTLLIFRGTIPNFTIENFSFLFYFMFIMGGLLFSYKIILFSNFIYVILYGGYALYSLTVVDYFGVMTHVSMFLLVANLSAVLIKMMIIIYIQKSNNEIETSKTIEKLIATTNNYIANIDSINSNPTDFFREFIDDFFHIGCKLLPKFDKASCYIVKDNEDLEYVDAIGYDIDLLNGCDFDPNEFVWNEKLPMLINGYRNTSVAARNCEYYKVYKEKYPNIKQSLSLSLSYATFKGAMSFDITEDSVYLFDKESVSTFKAFHKLVNSYMTMGSLYIDSSKLKTDIILSFVKTLGFYDDYTRNHSIDVANLTKELCDELELDTKTKELAYYASIVHDIGKIGISNEILNKKTRLTDKEFALIKNHTVSGFNILSEIKDLKEIAVIVKHHHERWDGYGYPDKLEGNGIPFISQIIGVCDSVSAMLSKRVYQSAKTIQEVIDELKEQRGKQFSPVPCDAMIKLLERRGLV